MAFDIEELKFCGMIGTVAEEEFAASLTDDREQTFAKALYEKYIAAGKPKNKKDWIKQELKTNFIYVRNPPAWIEQTTTPTWPFFEGKPMVFIDQLIVPDNEVSKATIAPGVVLYIFASKKPVTNVSGGWDMVYRIIEQVQDL
jgi:hypothetical protein